jgi:hypothetical protein
MTAFPNMEQLARDVQAILAANADGAKVYESGAPRRPDGQVRATFPFAVYTFTPRAPLDEAEEWLIDLFLDVWALGGWPDAYRVMSALDTALDGTVHVAGSGVMACDRNGACYQRMERDPDDERIRRMTGQYLIRFSPAINND